jgi:polyisoprenoid-binding protein YceI
MKARTLAEKLIKRAIKGESIKIERWVTFNRFNSYDASIVVDALFVDTLYADGTIIGHETNYTDDEYDIYELTGDAIFDLMDFMGITINQESYEQRD